MGKLKAMEEELERGRELAKQLRELLMMKKKTSFDNSSNKGKVCGAEDLVANVMASFTNTLFLLNNNNTHLINNLSSSSSSSFSIIIPSNSQDSQLSTSNNPTSPPTPSHKRRKSSHSWEQVSEISTTDDGHTWRKYGQKMILNNKHPRNYYRCTHKFDQGCKATKQVQRIQDEPPLYRTTYYGHHTCTNFLNPHIILDSPHPHHLSNSSSSFLLSFSDHHHKTNTNNNIPIPNPFISSSISSSFPNPIQDNNTTYNDSNNNVPSSSLFSTHQYDYGDLISSPLFYDHPDLLLHHHDDDLDALIFNPYEL